MNTEENGKWGNKENKGILLENFAIRESREIGKGWKMQKLFLEIRSIISYWWKLCSWWLRREMDNVRRGWGWNSSSIKKENQSVPWVRFIYLVVFLIMSIFSMIWEMVIKWEWGVWRCLWGLKREGVVLEIRRDVVELLSSVKGPLKIYKYKFQVR